MKNDKNLTDEQQNFDETKDPILEKPSDIDNGQSADIDSIGDDLIGSMSDVQNHAIEQHDLEQQKEKDKFADLVDSEGTPFNPEIHRTKADGNPSLSKLGKFMSKPNRKYNTRRNKKDTTQESDQQLSDQEIQQVQALGKVSANAVFSIGRALGGDEWTPVKNSEYDEVSALENAFAEYYKATGKTEISPSMGLAIALGSYAVPRFTKPVTQQRTKNIFTKIHGWWHNKKGKREEQARQKAEKIRKDLEKKESHTFNA